MSDSQILGQIAYKILNAPVKPWPFPHIFVPNVFPDIFYRDLLANLPADPQYSTGKSNYKGRKFADPKHLDLFRSDAWTRIAMEPFKRNIQARFTSKPAIYTDLRLIRDGENYSIGPHTDAPWKILSYLFYLPPDNTLQEHGTSIYLPKDPSFTCPGGPHHPYDRFDRIFTAPFLPNSLFAFFKTDWSFHGVEPIKIQCQRDLLLWNLYDSVARNGKT
jgi:hypothetical protein